MIQYTNSDSERIKKSVASRSMMVYYCGAEKCSSGHSFGPAVRSQYLLHYVVEGFGEYFVGGQKYKVKKGEAFLIKPGESTVYKANEDFPWEYKWIAFDGFEAKELIKTIGFEKAYVRKIPDPESFNKDIDGIINEFQLGKYTSYNILAFFYSAVAQLEKISESAGYEQEYFGKAAEYIRNNYGYSIKISDLARLVGIDRTYLYKVFLEASGQSPKQYLLTVRINAAKNMLYTGRYSVAETALSCGFSDSASFCNHFKRVTGKTPRQCISESRGKIDINK